MQKQRSMDYPSTELFCISIGLGLLSESHRNIMNNMINYAFQGTSTLENCVMAVSRDIRGTLSTNYCRIEK